MRSIATILIGLMLASCSHFAGDEELRDPAVSLNLPATYKAPQPDRSQIVGGLLEIFQDETLNALVAQALTNNLDVQLAAERLREAGYTADSELGNLLPRISGNFSGARSKDAQGRTGGSFSPTLDATWELDIWGKLQSQQAAREADALSLAEDYQAARDSIAAQVMQAWFDVVTAHRQSNLQQQRIANLQTSRQNSLLNYSAGLTQLDDLQAVDRDIAQAKATLAANNAAESEASRALQILLGDYPSGLTNNEYQLPSLLAAPSPGLPANLLTERPDLKAAWQTVVSADETANVAHKDMFPSLSLTGSFGVQSDQFSNLMSAPSIWSLASGIALPIFNAGQLRNNLHAAQSRAEQAWLTYLQTALGAFAEVEGALSRENTLIDQATQQALAVERAENTARIFQERYGRGLVNILDFLNAQNTVFNMKDELLRIRNERLKNRVTLALAIGKGV